MKKTIEILNTVFAEDRTPEKEEDIIGEFEGLLDWVQGHDGSLSRLNLILVFW